MLYGNHDKRVRMNQKMQLYIFLPLVIAIILAFSACAASKGSIVILESPNNKGFTMDFKEWSSKNKCEISLNKGDVLQFNVVREAGEIYLTVSCKNGSEPYTGNDVKSGIFTVTVHETDQYVVHITGKDATGKVTVKNIESSAE